jgi:hypothetical protein
MQLSGYCAEQTARELLSEPVRFLLIVSDPQ